MCDFITGRGTEDENGLAARIGSLAGGGEFYAYRQYTTRIICERYNGEINDAAHLLEIRLFNDKCEIRAVRSALGKAFSWRVIDDSKLTDEELKDITYSEIQYLDIDSTKSRGTNYCFTGGGSYTLPIENAERIELRHYGFYDENGLFTLSDFRIVRILAKGET